MGFLKFLKRDKSKDIDLGFDNFDVPPMPPGTLGAEEKYPADLPEFPELPDFDEPAPRMEETKKPISDVKIPLRQTEGMKEAVLQQPEDFGPIEDMKGDFGMYEPEEPMPKIRGGVHDMGPEPMEESHYEVPKADIREESGALRHKAAKGPVYIRMDNFRGILRNVSEIRSGLRASNEVLSKLSQIDANADKGLEKWRGIMADMQKKLVFADKALFNGEKTGQEKRARHVFRPHKSREAVL